MLVIAGKILVSSETQLLLPKKSKTFFNTIECYKNDKKCFGGIDLKLRNFPFYFIRLRCLNSFYKSFCGYLSRRLRFIKWYEHPRWYAPDFSVMVR
jgi:hypothetical protein